MRSTFDWSRATAVLLSILLVVALSALVACSVPGPSPTTLPTATVPQRTAGVGTPTPALATGPFNLSFATQYALNTCDTSLPAGTICIDTSGTGQGSNTGATLKSVGLQRTSIYTPSNGGACAPATTSGKLLITAQDTITFTGTGTFCRATQTATFTYTITGGTGAYQNASGSGTIFVPPPSSPTDDTESWSGTLLP